MCLQNIACICWDHWVRHRSPVKGKFVDTMLNNWDDREINNVCPTSVFDVSWSRESKRRSTISSRSHWPFASGDYLNRIRVIIVTNGWRLRWHDSVSIEVALMNSWWFLLFQNDSAFFYSVNWFFLLSNISFNLTHYNRYDIVPIWCSSS